MLVNISLAQGAPFQEINVPKGTTLAEIFDKYRTGSEYQAYVANVNNDIKNLTYSIYRDCEVQFLDIRSKSAFLGYQNSLVLVMLRAAKDVLGDRSVGVMTTLCESLYIEFGEKGITAAEVRALEKRMKEIIKADLPFERVHNEYTLDGFTATFYNRLVPSSGYVNIFALKKYKKGMLIRYPSVDEPDKIPEFKEDEMMYEAFREQDKWDEMLEVRYIKDINEKVKKGECREMIKMSEAQHDKKVVDIADEIIKRKKRIILILGPSSSGKTTTAKRLAIQLKVCGVDPIYISTDDYFVEREQTPRDEKGEYNFEGIDAIDVKLFNKQMNDLLAGKEVDIPIFDFIKGGKIFGQRITKLKEGQPIIIEGIHSFNPKLTGGIPDKEKFKLYISPLTQVNIDQYNRIPVSDTRLIRRLVRDSRTRNYDAEKTLKNWPKVRAGEMENIFPYSDDADVFFNTVHIYEICVLKKHAVEQLEKVTRDKPEYAEAKRLLRFLADVESFEDEELIASDSILREFIGGSIYEI